ncbi:hypothetical protein JKP88DRAFT_58800 [Tribonema minus]|uniref:Uncharacterized protein n=1 Tax=Tribonema minus TaxID=303371 RepID=A0A836CDZ8_9STRA|nr:hypothetical protein JKP88DRAFT_58800 [Tribonema minus]
MTGSERAAAAAAAVEARWMHGATIKPGCLAMLRDDVVPAVVATEGLRGLKLETAVTGHEAYVVTLSLPDPQREGQWVRAKAAAYAAVQATCKVYPLFPLEFKPYQKDLVGEEFGHGPGPALRQQMSGEQFKEWLSKNVDEGLHPLGKAWDTGVTLRDIVNAFTAPTATVATFLAFVERATAAERQLSPMQRCALFEVAFSKAGIYFGEAP